jgi:hypothetical protein
MAVILTRYFKRKSYNTLNVIDNKPVVSRKGFDIRLERLKIQWKASER